MKGFILLHRSDVNMYGNRQNAGKVVVAVEKIHHLMEYHEDPSKTEVRCFSYEWIVDESLDEVMRLIKEASTND